MSKLLRYCSNSHKPKKGEIVSLRDGFYWVKPTKSSGWKVVEWQTPKNYHYPNDGWELDGFYHYDDMFEVGNYIEPPKN